MHSTCGTYKYNSKLVWCYNSGEHFEDRLLVYEYPPAIVGGLGTYAENVTQEYIDLGHDVSVFTLNGGNLKTREILRGVEVHRPLIADASNVFHFLWLTI